MEELKAQGVFDNTVIILLGDNGRPFPRSKTSLYDGGMKTPLIVHWPEGSFQAGARSRSLVSSIDIAPAILEVAGLAVAPEVQGLSFLPICRDPETQTREILFGERNWHTQRSCGRMVRWGDYVYMRDFVPGSYSFQMVDFETASYAELLRLKEEGRLLPEEAEVFSTQRAKEQKGVLFSGFFKVLVPFMMMIPGVIAFHLYGPGLSSIDLAYPQLVRDVMPVYATGFFLAVLLGAVFSSFNSLLNSAATLFCLDVYAPMKKEEVSDAQMLRVAKIASIVIAIFSFIVAPLLQYAPDGLFQIIRIFTGFYNVPVIAVVLVGLFTKRVPALGAKIAIVFHVIAYGLFQFAFKEHVSMHFLHLYLVLFLVEVGIMLVIGHFRPQPEAWTYHLNNLVDMTPWRYGIPCASTLFSCVLATYLLFSKVGLVDGLTPLFWVLVALLVVINGGLWFWFSRKKSSPSLIVGSSGS